MPIDANANSGDRDKARKAKRKSESKATSLFEQSNLKRLQVRRAHSVGQKSIVPKWGQVAEATSYRSSKGSTLSCGKRLQPRCSFSTCEKNIGPEGLSHKSNPELMHLCRKDVQGHVAACERYCFSTCKKSIGPEGLSHKSNAEPMPFFRKQLQNFAIHDATPPSDQRAMRGGRE